jgi:hypothetical protein
MTARDFLMLALGYIVADCVFRYRDHRREKRAKRQPSRWLIERMAGSN